MKKKKGVSLSTDTPLLHFGNTKVELKFTNYFSLDQTKKYLLVACQFKGSLYIYIFYYLLLLFFLILF